MAEDLNLGADDYIVKPLTVNLRWRNWRGIEAAETARLTPLKINTVVIRGINDDEVVDIAALSLEKEWHIRFIEWMPLGLVACHPPEEMMPDNEIQERLTRSFGLLGPVPAAAGKWPGPHISIARRP